MSAQDEGVVAPLADAVTAPSLLDPDGTLRDLAGDCVHCGFCLPACPTYQLWGEEMDSWTAVMAARRPPGISTGASAAWRA